MSRDVHKRLSDFEPIDRIELKVIPRYKDSDLSGSEWRTSVLVQFFFKDQLLFEEQFHTMDQAILMLGGEWLYKTNPIPDKVLKMEDHCCDQPGCSDAALPKKHYLTVEYSSRGERLDIVKTTESRPIYRRFCERHSTRGDGSYEDSDSNYTSTFIKLVQEK